MRTCPHCRYGSYETGRVPTVVSQSLQCLIESTVDTVTTLTTTDTTLSAFDKGIFSKMNTYVGIGHGWDRIHMCNAYFTFPAAEL